MPNAFCTSLGNQTPTHFRSRKTRSNLLWLASVAIVLSSTLDTRAQDGEGVRGKTESTRSGDSQGEQCRLHAPLATTRMMRRTALAVMGRPPTLAEYQQVRGKDHGDSAVEALIDSWLTSNDYRIQMRRYHLENLLATPLPTRFPIRNNAFTLVPVECASGHSYVATAPNDPSPSALPCQGPVVSDLYDFVSNGPRRGMRTTKGGANSASCLYVPQTVIDPNYQVGDTLAFSPLPDTSPELLPPSCWPQADGTCREGYVEIDPYWTEPGQTIKVCALAAQQTRFFQHSSPSANFPAGQYSCDNFVGDSPVGQAVCGCGKDLGRCGATRNVAGQEALQNPIFPIAETSDGSTYTSQIETDTYATIRRSMQEQLLRMVDDHTFGPAQQPGQPAPYHELLTTRATWVNGPLVHYLRHMAGATARDRAWFEEAHDAMAVDGPLPLASNDGLSWQNSFVDRRWQKIERGPAHAGILTTHAFLMRFFTARARVNRFRIAFLDQSFQPSAQAPEQPGESTAAGSPCFDEAEVGMDLRQRCNCRHCHNNQGLESMSAFFGPFQEYGTALNTMFPSELESYHQVAALFMPVNVMKTRGHWESFYQATRAVDEAAGGIEQSIYRLRPLAWIDDYPNDYSNYLQGPRGLVQSEGLSSKAGPTPLALGTVHQLFRFLMGRDALSAELPGASEERSELIEHAAQFESQKGCDWNFRCLVKRIITSELFRRAP